MQPSKLNTYFKNRANFSGQNTNIDFNVDPDRALELAKREPNRAGKIVVASVTPIESAFSSTLEKRIIIHSISNIKPISFAVYTPEHEMLVRTTIPVYDYVERTNSKAHINLATGIFITRDGMLHLMPSCGKKIDILTIMPNVEPALNHNNITDDDCKYSDEGDEKYMEQLINHSIGWAAYTGADGLFLDVIGTGSSHRNPYNVCLNYVQAAVKKYAKYFDEVVVSCLHENMMGKVNATFSAPFSASVAPQPP